MSTIVADSIEPRTSGGAVTFPNRPAFAVRGYGSLQDGATVNGIGIASGTDIICATSYSNAIYSCTIL